MSDFFTAFVRPLFPVASVGGFLASGGIRWQIIVAVGVGMYMTYIEIQRQGGWR